MATSRPVTKKERESLKRVRLGPECKNCPSSKGCLTKYYNDDGELCRGPDKRP